jgi:hypothetical protein
VSDTPAADEAETELVLNPGSFTGPERREVQQRLKIPFGDLLDYTHQAVRRALATELADPQPVLMAADGAMVFPDEVLQVMAWVQARRADPTAQLEDFDGLTLSDLNSARLRGLRPKATEPERSTRSSPGSGSAAPSRASRGKQPSA